MPCYQKSNDESNGDAQPQKGMLGTNDIPDLGVIVKATKRRNA
jgi:hypothetical protein